MAGADEPKAHSGNGVKNSDSLLLGGTNPKKAGQSVDLGGTAVPVFATVAETMAATGADVSVITYGVGVHLAREAGQACAASGIDVEVLDLRTLLPGDQEALMAALEPVVADFK